MSQHTKSQGIFSNVLIIGGVFILKTLFFFDSCQAAQPVSGTPANQVYDVEDKVTAFTQLVTAKHVVDNGGKAYVKAAQKMAYSSPGEALDARWREPLYDVFGSLVNQIIVHWGASLRGEWRYSNGVIKLDGDELDAQSYGYHVYFKADKDALKAEKFLPLLIHQLFHVKQFEGYKINKSLRKFGEWYFLEYHKAGKVYADNLAEQKAQKFVKASLALLQFVVTIRNETPDPIMVRYSWKNTPDAEWVQHQIMPGIPLVATSKKSPALYIVLPRGDSPPIWKLPARPFFKKEVEPAAGDGEQYAFRANDEILNLERASAAQEAATLVLVKD